MGFSLDDLFGDAKKAVEENLEKIKSVGIPALQNAGEKWAANVLQEQSKKILDANKGTEAQLQQNIATVLKEPSVPGSFGSFLSGGLTGAVSKEYGLPIVLGIVGIGVVGFILLRK
jgi:hypothetical protein